MMNFTSAVGGVLSMDSLARKAPAIFAEAPRTGLSERYSFLKTSDVVEALSTAGWNPVFAAQGRARDITKAGVQRHVVRFRHSGATALQAGGLFPELVLLNCHDGTSAYQLHAGIFRLVCGNGLIVSDGTFGKISIRHSGVTKNEVIDASFRVLDGMPQLGESIEAMRAVSLTEGEQQAFAGAAALARWGDQQPVEARALLTPRRMEDRSNDLWTTYNRIQENSIKGGVRGRTAEGKRMKVRAINSVAEDTKLNKALWQLAEEMKRLKTAA